MLTKKVWILINKKTGELAKEDYFYEHRCDTEIWRRPYEKPVRATLTWEDK